jgi:hypothetical protein
MKVSLEPHEREKLKDLVSHWAEAVPAPDEPIVGFAGSSQLYSPRELVQAVRDETEVGKKYLQSLANLAFNDLINKKFGG